MDFPSTTERQPDQRTPDWFRARLGNFTGSTVWKLTKRDRKGGFSDTAMSYIYQVAAERDLNPKVLDDEEWFRKYLDETSVETKAMRLGTEYEGYARVAYSNATKAMVAEAPSVRHPEIGHFASSPDGIVMEGGEPVGCIEIKCPGQDNFMRYRDRIKDAAGLKAERPEYYYQCQAHMMCTGTGWCDFVAYFIYMRHPLHWVRIPRDDEAVELLERSIAMAEDCIKERFGL